MIEQPEIEYVLSNYFSAEHGLPIEETMPYLQALIERNPSFAFKLLEEVNQAFKDGAFDWKATLARTNSGYFADDDAAREFAAEILGPPLGLRPADLMVRPITSEIPKK